MMLNMPKLYEYTFSNNESGKLNIDIDKYDDREDVTRINYDIDSDYDLALILSPSLENEVSLFISYVSQEKTDYMNLYNLIKKDSQKRYVIYN